MPNLFADIINGMCRKRIGERITHQDSDIEFDVIY